ncbi:MAG: ATP-binding cassette domain-containing protein [Streptosporangiales bacterium]|nr:ATP-binding cassette domain-containing protein [Streptosporangiales bacterium]
MTSTSLPTASEPVPVPESTPVLHASGVTMRFGGLVAVNAVDFEVHDREIVGLIGPNGAGKTTFFNCLTGMYRPTAGRVLYRGNALKLKPRKVAAAGIARTFQNIRLFGNMTALENIMVGRYCRTKSGVLTSVLRGRRYRTEERETVDRARELLGFVGLASVGNTLARNLSYGDQRRLEIARALATDPGLLLLDEPTAGMNPNETGKVTDLIFEIREQGLGVVVIEHDMRFIFRLCDRITCLVRGEKLVEGTAEQVQSDERVIDAYLGTGTSSTAEPGDEAEDGRTDQ